MYGFSNSMGSHSTTGKFLRITRALRRGLATGALLVFAASLWTHSAWAQQGTTGVKPRVAVLEFEGVGISAQETAAITDQMRNELVNLNKFTVLDRAQTEKVMAELAFQQGGVTDANQAIKMGKMLNVQNIVTGRVTGFKDAYQVNVQMINVETAEIERSENILYKGDIIGLLSDNIASIATRLSRTDKDQKEVKSNVVTGSAPAPESRDVGPRKPRWSLWTGLGLMAVGGALQMQAVSTNSEAVDKAKKARAQNDPKAFKEAKDMKSQAVSQQTTAMVVGGTGVALLGYYMFIASPAPVALNLPGGGPATMTPYLVALNPRTWSAGVAVNW